MKLLKLHNWCSVSEQIPQGKDPDGDDDSEEIKTRYEYYKGHKDLSYKGGVWSLRERSPNKEELQMVKDAEEKFKQFNLLVYHIHRCKVNDDMVLYAFLVVGQNEDEWEHARYMTERGLPDCVAPVYGYGGFEYGLLPVKSTDCGLFRTN
jgi:hypothetical protein